MSETVQKIKERLSIVDVVQPYVKLTKAGKYWKGLSPFNKEKTPSFYVSPDRGLYHCFSSGKGGDMFTFIEEMEGVDFKGALAILAEKAGIELRPEPQGARDERERVYDALTEASLFFEATLAARADARAYLLSRGLTEASVASWHVGYALKEWQVLRDALTKKGFSEGILERAGLVKKGENENRYYDRFRGRIMFPLRDVSGRVIAFSGRIFEDDPEHPQAKYLNSPETPVFDKSRALYGIDRAREGVRRLGAAVLVEGQLDLLMAHQAGFDNAVATSGTAFTEEHAALLKRGSENLLIAYDGDRAGIAAAGRAAAIALAAGMNVKIVKLPLGADPADLIKERPEAFKEAVKGALHVVDFYLAHLTDAKYDPRTFRLEVSRVVLPYVGMIQNRIDQAHFIGRVAETLGVPADAVAAEVRKLQTEAPKTDSPVAASAAPFLSRADSITRLLAGIKAALGDSEVLKEYPEDERRVALFEGDFFLERHTDPAERQEALKELEADLARENAHERYREALLRLRSAESAHDAGESERLMQELSVLAREL